MIEKPPTGRAQISYVDNAVEIVISPQMQFFGITILGALIPLLVGIFTILSHMLASADASMFFFDLFFLIPCGFVLYLFLWISVGKEVIVVEDGILEVGHLLFSWYRCKKYDLRDVRHFGLNDYTSTFKWRLNYSSFSGGISALKFDYGMSTIYFANIEAAEARMLLNVLKENDNFTPENFD